MHTLITNTKIKLGGVGLGATANNPHPVSPPIWFKNAVIVVYRNSVQKITYIKSKENPSIYESVDTSEKFIYLYDIVACNIIWCRIIVNEPTFSPLHASLIKLKVEIISKNCIFLSSKTGST